MTTAVTTTTVTTLSSTHTAGMLGVLLIVIFIALVIGKDILIGSSHRNSVHWNGPLNVGVVPLLIAFVVIVGVNLAKVVS